MKIFYDVDTQNDFMNKDTQNGLIEKGALYVPEAESIKPNLKKLTDFARKNNIPVIGSVDRHFGTEEYKGRELELQRWGGPFPDHCMYETRGERKIDETIANIGVERNPESVSRYCDMGEYIKNELNNKINKRRINSLVNGLKYDLKRNSHFVIRGIYFEKQSYDVFTNPAFAVFLDLMKVKEAVIYGVATDYCVKAAVLGMQKKGIQCYVVEDAIKGVNQKTTQEALEEMVKANFVTTEEILRS